MIGLLLIDVQERLFPSIAYAEDVLNSIRLLIRSFRILELPIVVTEQYPKGLGTTLEAVRSWLPDNQQYLLKTSFSAVGDAVIKQTIETCGCDQWLLVGVETHICVLQTAKDLLKQNLKVIIANDATSSRTLNDFSTAIDDLRHCGVRVSTTETVLFELLKNDQHPHFKEISKLVK